MFGHLSLKKLKAEGIDDPEIWQEIVLSRKNLPRIEADLRAQYDYNAKILQIDLIDDLIIARDEYNYELECLIETATELREADQVKLEIDAHHQLESLKDFVLDYKVFVKQQELQKVIVENHNLIKQRDYLIRDYWINNDWDAYNYNKKREFFEFFFLKKK
jgi:hypothetical protein